MKNKGKVLWMLLLVMICVGIALILIYRTQTKATRSTKFWGSEQMALGTNEADDNQQFYGVSDLFSDEDGNLYVVEQGNHRVQVFDKNGAFLHTIGKEGQGPGEFMAPIAGGCFGENVFVADEDAQQILVFNRKDGSFRYAFKLNGTPSDLCINKSGDLLIGYMASTGKIIHVYNADGVCTASFGKLDDKYKALAIFNRICSLTLDNDGNLYVGYHYLNLLQKYNPGGELIGETETKFQFPDSVGIHGTAKGGFHIRPMFWSLFPYKGSICFVTAIGGPLSKILKSDNYTIVMSKDLQEQTIVKNPFPVLCGVGTKDGSLLLCDMDFIVHVFRK